MGSARIRPYQEWSDRMLRDGIERCEKRIDRLLENVSMNGDVRDRLVTRAQEWLDRYEAVLKEHEEGKVPGRGESPK